MYKYMDNKQNEQTCIELGHIPEILKGGKAYKAIAKTANKEHKQYIGIYREKLYLIMDEILGDDKPKNRSSYRKYFSNPELNVNKAFLENQRSNKKKWHKIINAMYYAMSEVLMLAINDSKRLIEFHTDRQKELSKILDTYLKESSHA